jgi:hypothetical protein
MFLSFNWQTVKSIADVGIIEYDITEVVDTVGYQY